MPGAIFMGVFRVLMGGIDGLGKPQYSTYASFAAVVSTIVLNIVLIPRYGMIGAATATSISGFVAFAIVAGYYKSMSKARWSEFLIVRGTDIRVALTSLRDAILKRERD
jgi:O-antigen/teichoic acid export membrane protein